MRLDLIEVHGASRCGVRDEILEAESVESLSAWLDLSASAGEPCVDVPSQ
jgi:hypothetical protein